MLIVHEVALTNLGFYPYDEAESTLFILSNLYWIILVVIHSSFVKLCSERPKNKIKNAMIFQPRNVLQLIR